MSIKDDLAKKRANLTGQQVALLEKRRQGLSRSQEEQSTGIPARPQGVAIPASFAQQRLWFLLQLEPGAATYNEFTALRITGQLERAVLVQTLREIQRRHEILRTSLVVVDRKVLQSVRTVEDVHLLEKDLSLLPEDQREARLRQSILAEVQYPFDLTNGNLWRAALFKLTENEHFFLAVMHHAVCDAWSLNLFSTEFAALYAALQRGQPSPLPELKRQYADYACWQQQTLTDSEIERHLAYWKNQLSGTLPTLDLPTDRSRPATQSNRGRRKYFAYPRALYQDLQAFSHTENVTLFMTLLAAFKILLCQYTGQEDIIVGSPVAGRTYPELENLIGLFTNTLPLRTHLGGQPGFREVVRRVRTMALEAYAHQDLPFERIVAEVCPDRDLSHTPLFQTMFILQNVPATSTELPGLTLTLQEMDNYTAKFDLELDIQETAQGLMGYMEYSTDLFDETTIDHILSHFQQLLQNAVQYPDRPITRLSLLTQAEQQTILHTWNATKTAYPAEQCYHELFEEQVRRTPSALAVVDGEERLTYQELNRRANRLACYLRRTGVGPDVLVALLAERGWQLLTAILAVFKAGGAYLPLDPAHPSARLRQILEHSRSQLVLTTSEFLPALAQVQSSADGGNACPFATIESILQREELTTGDLNSPALPQQLAYVIYTSGSTGQPKGAMIEQRSMINHLFAKIRDLDLSANDLVAQTASQCFDISVWQMLAPLLVGASVEIFPGTVTRDPMELLRQVARQRVTILEIVPALLHIALANFQRLQAALPDLSALRWLIMTGEPLPPELIQRWFACYPRIPLLNAYGPTECADDVTHHSLQVPLDESVLFTPIGRPVANTQLYVLNQALEAIPIGIVGELYVGGAGVGRGYLGEPARTAETFLANPFSTNAGERIYKTGDLARWLADGTLEYLGRSDAQVKVRGYRIELGEIEAVLAQCPALNQCVVLVQEDTSAQKRLVAYVTANPDSSTVPQTVDLARFLKERLPEYMVPSAFVLLESMPLSANGKIDRQALLSLEQKPVWSEESSTGPQTPLEEILVFIWAEVLELEQIDTKKSFFELGGHSLLAAQVMARLSEVFELDFPLRWIFETPTITGLATTMTQDEVYRERIEMTAQMALQVLMMEEEEIEATMSMSI
ncbi:MAG TPA: amino acid adenylation domain-containing protein [Ktedonobacteraceae bacterium]|nr:amino acid adenylation domain-containing protein [Ktedonobacteraceae bacterium]